MTNLKSTIEDLANEFALSILGALRAASIDELTDVSGLRTQSRGGMRTGGRAAVVDTTTRKRARGGRLGRRSTEDIGRMVENIVSLLGKHPDGLRAEQIRDALGCQAKELPRPLADGLGEGRITKTGQKRATTYFAGNGGGASAPKRRGARASARKSKRG